MPTLSHGKTKIMIRNNGLPFKSVQIKKHQCYFYYIILCWKVRVLTPIIGCHFNTNFEKNVIILRSRTKTNFVLGLTI